VDFFDAHGLTGENRAEIDCFRAQTDAATTGDHDGVEGLVDVRQSGVHALGRLVDLRRALHVQGFVRTLVVEDLDELVEPSLLLRKIGSRRQAKQGVRGSEGHTVIAAAALFIGHILGDICDCGHDLRYAHC
jgi:hypothetical protein